MLNYNGSLIFDIPLSNKECYFLNDWQNVLKKVYEEQSQTSNKEEKVECALKINQYLGINLTPEQLWTIMFAYNPLIKFDNHEIIIHGFHKKGQLREALLSYEHLFIGNNPIFTNFLYEDLSFLTKHNFTGIIEARKYNDKNPNKEWCYLFEKNYVASIECETKEEYLNNPDKYTLDIKDDTFIDKLEKYFPKEFIHYAKINRMVNEQVSFSGKIDKPRKKI